MNTNQNVMLRATVKSEIIETLAKTFGIDVTTDWPKFLLGKSAENNWQIYKLSDQCDTVFHLDKFSSPYVIVNKELTSLTKEQIHIAAQLCKNGSKYRDVPNIAIMYTPISNTFLGEKLGSFIIRSNHKVNIVKI